MPTYKYSAMSRDGKKVSGVIEGFNQLDAVSKIKDSFSVVLQISEVKEKGKAAQFLSLEVGGNKLNDKAFTLMCSQFSVILRAGIPITRTVELIADKMTDKPLKRILEQVAKDVESGRSLSVSFAERGKKLFPITFLETIHAGEEAGTLDTAFDSISKHYTKQSKMKGKVKGALIYPAFVLVVAIIVVIVLMVKVVPTFTAIFDEYDAELPLPTQMLIAMSDFFQRYWIVMLGVLAAVLGNIANLNGASQFANTMAMMLNAGLPMTKSVTITSRVMDNYYFSQEVGKCSSKLEEGQTLGRSLKDANCLPAILVDMTAVGEDSGELASTLGMTAEYYDSELEQAIADALAKLEPSILVFLAGFAGFIVVAIYMAMFGMYSAM